MMVNVEHRRVFFRWARVIEEEEEDEAMWGKEEGSRDVEDDGLVGMAPDGDLGAGGYSGGRSRRSDDQRSCGLQ